jgi:predicted N-formylglutamate amidohydrolase
MTSVLAPNDAPPFRIIPATGDLPLVLICEHAGNYVPQRLGHLGLNPDDLSRHFAVDIGTGAVTEILAQKLGCAAILCNYSRLVVDCNRKPESSASMTAEEDGFIISGNQSISPDERQARLDEIFTPFHAAVAAQIAQVEAQLARPVLILTIHSFTPQYRAMPLPRPWHIGVLWHRERKVSQALLEFLRARPELEVGDNQPYSLIPPAGTVLPTYTIERHADEMGRAGFVIEIRNDEIVTARGVERYAKLLADFFSTSTF